MKPIVTVLMTVYNGTNDPLVISKKINALIENISLKKNLNGNEIDSLKSVIFQRIRYGFNIAFS